ncbi:MAG: beta-ketoacyl-ACP synthase II [Clostridiales bacterium]|nr:beta-ketoacyl-ACP synthase II [Clostridiales bacterium]
MRRVVVTGMGVVSPLGNSVPEFCKNLDAGVCGIGPITRFDTTDFAVKVAGEVQNFDPLCCMAKSEVRKTDLYTQYALAAAAQAVEQSGLAGHYPSGRLGVYIGSGCGGMGTMTEECAKLLKGGSKTVSPYFVTMMISNMAAGAVAIKYGANGPCLPVVTACATSSHAIGEAVRCIRHGYADAIIAGGSEAPIIPLAVAGFTNCMALTQNGDPKTACTPFDARRSGFVMAEGAGILALEEHQHAVDRGATILAEVCGYGSTCDAHHVTAPHPEAIHSAAAIRMALDEAGMDGARMYINAHGTSTPLNDRCETVAIKQALGERAYQALISSSKSMTGHMLGAAGGVEAIAAIHALTSGRIPPTIGYRDADPDCDLNYVPNHSVEAQVDLALSISLGFGGHNACLAFSRG